MGCQCAHSSSGPTGDLSSLQKTFASKTLLLGETKVGKTSVANRFCSNRFSEDYTVTIGGTYLQKRFSFDSHELIYHLWDCCGDERFATLLPVIWKDANAVIFVYDISNSESFHKVNQWRKNLLEMVPPNRIVQGLVGNKSDLFCKGVESSLAQRYAEDNQMFFAEISAKSGEGLDFFFNRFAGLILNHLRNESSKLEKKKSS